MLQKICGGLRWCRLSEATMKLLPHLPVHLPTNFLNMLTWEGSKEVRAWSPWDAHWVQQISFQNLPPEAWLIYFGLTLKSLAADKSITEGHGGVSEGWCSRGWVISVFVTGALIALGLVCVFHVEPSETLPDPLMLAVALEEATQSIWPV